MGVPFSELGAGEVSWFPNQRGRGISRGTNMAEPDDMETLNLATINNHSWNGIEYIRIGVVPEDAAGPDGTVSFQLVHFSTDYKCTALQANLTKAEIDIVIAGLQAARERMEAERIEFPK